MPPGLQSVRSTHLLPEAKSSSGVRLHQSTDAASVRDQYTAHKRRRDCRKNILANSRVRQRLIMLCKADTSFESISHIDIITLSATLDVHEKVDSAVKIHEIRYKVSYSHHNIHFQDVRSRCCHMIAIGDFSASHLKLAIRLRREQKCINFKIT